MPGPILHVGAAMTCTHAAPVQIQPGQPRVLLSGQPAATMADLYLVAGCPFAPVAPHPCVRLQWTMPAARVLINGMPAVLATSVGLCLAADQAPQGAPKKKAKR